jgi:predicted anti-sigma-YlaC factor YlaD
MLRSRRDLACQEFVEVVTDYLDDAMSRRDAARLEAHVSACHGCTEYLEQMRRTVRLAGRLTVADVPAAGRDQLLRMFQEWKDGRAT